MDYGFCILKKFSKTCAIKTSKLLETNNLDTKMASLFWRSHFLILTENGGYSSVPFWAASIMSSLAVM